MMNLGLAVTFAVTLAASLGTVACKATSTATGATGATAPTKPAATRFEVGPTSVGPYSLSMSKEQLAKLPGAVVTLGAVTFEGGAIVLAFQGPESTEPCELTTTHAAARTPDGPGVGDKLEVWEARYGKAQVLEATGDLFFHEGLPYSVAVTDGVVTQIMLGGCGE